MLVQGSSSEDGGGIVLGVCVLVSEGVDLLLSGVFMYFFHFILIITTCRRNDLLPPFLQIRKLKPLLVMKVEFEFRSL